MWFITLVVLALAAYLIIKAVKAQSARKAADDAQATQGSGLTGSLKHDSGLQDAKAPQQTASQAPQSAVPEGMTAGSASAESTDAGGSTAATIAASAAATGAVTASAAVSGASTLAGQAADTTESGLHTGDQLADIREMLKILNLAESDASRLGISPEQFTALRKSHGADDSDASMPSGDTQSDIADKLRRMLA